MMSLAAIEHLANKVAREARANGRYPIYLTLADIESDNWQRMIPNIGSWHPRGFKPLDDPIFVDSSGFGTAGEAAYTIEQFRGVMRDMTREHGGLAWAIVQEGQFQVYIQAFKAKGR